MNVRGVTEITRSGHDPYLLKASQFTFPCTYKFGTSTMATPEHVRDLVLEISDNSWVIGHKLLLSRQPTAPSLGCSWSDGSGGSYTISELASPPSSQRYRLPPTCPLQLVHDAGDSNAAWRIGEAFLKVQDLRASYRNRTREHTTLAYLHDPAHGPVSFPIPRVLYHQEFDNRYYLVTSRVPGETLEKAWPTMNETNKQACVDSVVQICRELAQRKGSGICGVDGGHLSDNWMKPPRAPDGYAPQDLLAYCKEIEMDCSAFVLHHCDMGPTNLIIDLTQGCRVGVIDWEMTGFVPIGWVRTKFCVCWAMDFDFAGDDEERSRDWRQRVQIRLGREGFPEVADAWKHRFWKRVSQD